MPKGKVKWFNPQKGYGFIEQDNGKDLFVHHSEIQDGLILEDGMTVNYEVGEGRKGPCAVKVGKAE